MVPFRDHKGSEGIFEWFLQLVPLQGVLRGFFKGLYGWLLGAWASKAIKGSVRVLSGFDFTGFGVSGFLQSV